jgi:hypothetical protein
MTYQDVFLATSLSSVAELIEGCVDIAAANGVRWGTMSALATALSHFPKLETELELLGSGCNVDLTEDQVDDLGTQTHQDPGISDVVHPSVSCSWLS